jgi:peptide methionine sulfoxide reductase msrA/msrB
MRILLFNLLLFLLSTALYSADTKTEEIIFAGGCFWCIEAPFDKTPGVISAVSGYINGETSNPTYKQVSSGGTGHIEAVKVTFDPAQVSLKRIFEIFWQSFDPTDLGGSFYDRGNQYSSGVFYLNNRQKAIAQKSIVYINSLKLFTSKIVTPVIRAKVFHPAEKYHQDYHKKKPAHYQRYRKGSGRDSFISKIWKEKPLSLPDKIFKNK